MRGEKKEESNENQELSTGRRNWVNRATKSRKNMKRDGFYNDNKAQQDKSSNRRSNRKTNKKTNKRTNIRLNKNLNRKLSRKSSRKSSRK